MMNLIGRLDLSYEGDREIFELLMKEENGQEQTETDENGRDGEKDE